MKFITNKILFKKIVFANSQPLVYYEGQQVLPGTPDNPSPSWERAENGVRKYFQGMAGIDDLVKAHVPEIPGLNHELRIDSIGYRPDWSGVKDYVGNPEKAPDALSVRYNGQVPGVPSPYDYSGLSNVKAFQYSSTYRPNDEFNHNKHLDFGSMYNHNMERSAEEPKLDEPINQSVNKALPQLITQLTPHLQNVGVDSVRTEAMSNGHRAGEGYYNGMNGANTWSKLGFGFDSTHSYSSSERDNYYKRLAENLSGYNENVHPNDLKTHLNSIEHPILHKDILKGLGYSNVAQAVHKTLKDDFSYHAKLNLDPKDAGYKIGSRLGSFVSKRKNPQTNMETIPNG